MTNKSTRNASDIDSVVDLLIEDLSTLSDEEILKEAQEEFGDYKAEVEKMRLSAQAYIKKRMQGRLAEARQAFAQRKSTKPVSPRFAALTLEEKKTIIGSVKNASESLNQKVTMAARNESELTEQDLNEYIQSLFELGLIDENGKIK